MIRRLRSSEYETIAWLVSDKLAYRIVNSDIKSGDNCSSTKTIDFIQVHVSILKIAHISFAYICPSIEDRTQAHIKDSTKAN